VSDDESRVGVVTFILFAGDAGQALHVIDVFADFDWQGFIFYRFVLCGVRAGTEKKTQVEKNQGIFFNQQKHFS
ncbi:MAG: hypothetical protein RL020_1117, partial [Pseudomonadota bacterium]